MVLLMSTSVYSQFSVDKSLYQHAADADEDLIENIETLVHYLAQPTNSKKELAEVISYWITINIDYDLEAFIKDNNYGQTWYETIVSKKAICQGYAELFKAMCAVAEIETFIISGYAKGFGYQQGDSFEKSNHVWNVAFIGDQYYHFDLTWATGFVEKNANESILFITELQPEFLFSSSKQFLKNHLPAQPRWQLIEKPISMDVFITGRKPKRKLTKDIFYNYQDSIMQFAQLHQTEQILKDALDAYAFYPSQLELAWGYQHLAYNISVSDSNEEEMKKAIEYYEKAILIFNEDLTDRYEKLIKNCRKGISYIKQKIR